MTECDTVSKVNSSQAGAQMSLSAAVGPALVFNVLQCFLLTLSRVRWFDRDSQLEHT